MEITLNGKPAKLAEASNLAEIITRFCPPDRKIIAELNGEIVKSSQWAALSVREGDTLELVGLVGGG